MKSSEQLDAIYARSKKYNPIEAVLYSRDDIKFLLAFMEQQYDQYKVARILLESTSKKCGEFRDRFAKAEECITALLNDPCVPVTDALAEYAMIMFPSVDVDVAVSVAVNINVTSTSTSTFRRILSCGTGARHGAEGPPAH